MAAQAVELVLEVWDGRRPARQPGSTWPPRWWSGTAPLRRRRQRKFLNSSRNLTSSESASSVRPSRRAANDRSPRRTTTSQVGPRRLRRPGRHRARAPATSGPPVSSRVRRPLTTPALLAPVDRRGSPSCSSRLVSLAPHAAAPLPHRAARARRGRCGRPPAAHRLLARRRWRRRKAQPQSDAGSATSGTVNWWGWTPTDVATAQGYIAAFNKEYPDIKVNFKLVAISDWQAALPPGPALRRRARRLRHAAGRVREATTARSPRT